MHITPKFLVDGLQYCDYSASIFQQFRDGGVDAVHVTICYHEDFKETVKNIETWYRHFQNYSEYIFQGFTAADIEKARQESRTAIFFGCQNCSVIEDDIGLLEIIYRLGIRFMQLSYNNQSLLATGCYESEDTGLTRMGKKVVKEMNRLGMVVDMSHSSTRSTLEAIEYSDKPIAITHANPHSWSPGLRNKPDDLLKALAQKQGMLGFSLYPHHLKNKSNCSCDDFCAMIAEYADKLGIDNIGIGSDLCQNQPDSIVHWMRNGTWTFDTDYGEGSASDASFPPQPTWFTDNTGFINIINGLKVKGFSQEDLDKVMGMNWHRFFDQAFG